MSFFNKLFGSEKSPTAAGLDWKILITEEELAAIIERSKQVPCAIFKHSTRCSVSAMAKRMLERDWSLTNEQAEIYYLDLITYRPVSNKIAADLGVHHESPQLLLLKDGEVVYHASHNEISAEKVAELVAE